MAQTFSTTILSGIKKVLFTPWNGETLDLAESNRYELQHLVEDTVAISQDENETNEVGCETRDEPLYEATTLGKFQVTMESGNIDPELLSKCLGYYYDANEKVAYAPASYKKLYAHIEVVMEESSFVLPRVLLNGRIDASSLKTGIARGVISGSAYSADASWTDDKDSKQYKIAAPFFFIGKGGTVPTVTALGKGQGTYVE